MVNGYRLEFTDEVAFSFLIGLYENGRIVSTNSTHGFGKMWVRDRQVSQ
jgi:hypothetical protein